MSEDKSKEQKIEEEFNDEEESEVFEGIEVTDGEEGSVEYGVADERETVEVYLEDLEALAETIAEYESDEDIETKIEKTLVDNRTIYLQGEINEQSVSEVIAMIHYYNLDDDNNGIPSDSRKNIKIYISSEGGELMWCKKLLACMENSKCKIETISEGGQIASAGFVIFISGDIRKLSRHSEPMYHNLSAGFSGSYSEMKNQIALYERIQGEIDDYIVERTEIPLKKLQSYRKKNQDWHMTFTECKKYKIFDVEI